MISYRERGRIIKLLEIAVRLEGEREIAGQHLDAVRRMLAVHNCTLADALIDREALALLDEARKAAAPGGPDPLGYDG